MLASSSLEEGIPQEWPAGRNGARILHDAMRSDFSGQVRNVPSMGGIIHKACVRSDGRWLVILFDDGHATQGKDRADALLMAADLRATIDNRDPSAYWSRWAGKTEIWVLALTPEAQDEVQYIATSREVGLAARCVFGSDRATFDALADR